MRGLILWTLAAAAVPARASAADCSETGVGELGAGLVEHSCFHSTNGPFLEVVATPGAGAGAATPNLDPVHTQYTVAIDPAQTNVVTYMPVRSGTWAIFGDAEVPHELVDDTGAALPVRLTHAVQGCPALPVVRVFALTALTRYTLRLGPSRAAATTTRVVVEKVSDFEAEHGRDVDGDGFGGATDVVITPCVPPSGYVRNVTDCDDADPDIHPDAIERCDGVDNNCNGLGDEDACTVGGGGCAAGGVDLAPSPWLLLAALVVASRLRRGERR